MREHRCPQVLRRLASHLVKSQEEEDEWVCVRAQAIDAKGYQQELPDIWLTNGNPWEIARNNITYRIGFYGTVDNFKWTTRRGGGHMQHQCPHLMRSPSEGLCRLGPLLQLVEAGSRQESKHGKGQAVPSSTELLAADLQRGDGSAAECMQRGVSRAQVIAKAYDNPIPGYKTNTVGNLRLWEALPVAEFDLDAFNKGEYDKVCPRRLDAKPGFQARFAACWR